MKDMTLYWKSINGLIKVSAMETSHLINAVKITNKIVGLGLHGNDEYHECYDEMYKELNVRGVDTDFELDNMYPSLKEGTENEWD